MARDKSWSVKGVDEDAKELARDAAQAAGLTIGAWIDRAIQKTIAEAENPAAHTTPTPMPDTTQPEAIVPTPSPDLPARTALAPPPGAREGKVEGAGEDGNQITGGTPHDVEEIEVGLPAMDVPPLKVTTAIAGNDQPSLFEEPAGISDLERRVEETFRAKPEPERRGTFSQPPTDGHPPHLRTGPLRRLVTIATFMILALSAAIWLFASLFEPEQTAQTDEPALADAQTGGQAAETPAQNTTREGTTGEEISAASQAQGQAQGQAGGLAALAERAKAGEALAQHDLGVRYAQGNGVTADLKEAARWFERAARQGLANAQYNLGVLYERGEGVPRDPKLAFFWYQSAAEQGHLRAQHNLGVVYAEGRGTPQNYQLAAKWFGEAANGGLAEAQHSLAVLYERGLGLTKDAAKAQEWYQRAAAAGYGQAPTDLAIQQRPAQSSPTDPTGEKPTGEKPPGEKSTGPNITAPNITTPETSAPQIAAVQTPPTAPESAPLTRAEIKELQQLLASLNFNPGQPDGVIGARTRDAIRLYRQFAGLPGPDAPDRELLEDLRAVAETTNSGKR